MRFVQLSKQLQIMIAKLDDKPSGGHSCILGMNACHISKRIREDGTMAGGGVTLFGDKETQLCVSIILSLNKDWGLS